MAKARKPIILDVDTGYETVQIRDHGEIIGEFTFNPADSAIATRFNEVARYFASVRFDDTLSEEKQMEQISKICDEIKDKFDYLFNCKVSDGIFKNCGPMSITRSGEPYFAYILEKIGDVISDACDERNQQKMERVRKAVGEYADAPAMAPMA